MKTMRLIHNLAVAMMDCANRNPLRPWRARSTETTLEAAQRQLHWYFVDVEHELKRRQRLGLLS